MKSLALGFALLLALAIGWLLWNSRASVDPPVVARAPADSTPAPNAEELPTAAASEASRAALGTGSKLEVVAAPVPPVPADSSGILVRGTVRDEQGNPVASCGLDWVDERGRRTHTAATNGSYSVAGLRPGHFIVVVWGTDLRREEIETELAADPEVQQRDFVAHPQPDIRVRLRITGADVSSNDTPNKDAIPVLARGIALRATRHPPPPLLRATPVTGGVEYSECGTYFPRGMSREPVDIPPDLIGRLRPAEVPPFFVGLYCGNARLESRILEEFPRELVFTLEADRIRAVRCGVRARVVRSEDGTPIPAQVVLLDLLPKKTDAEGHVEFSNLLPGTHALDLVLYESGSTQRQRIELAAGAVRDLGDVALRPVQWLELRFEYPGEFRPTVHFTLLEEATGDAVDVLTTPMDEGRTSGPDDTTRIPFPGPGRFVLRVQSVETPGGGTPALLAALPVHAVLGEAPSGALTVKLLPVTEVCLRPPRESRRDSRWVISLADGEPYRIASVRGRAPSIVGLPQGTYTIARIDTETAALGRQQSFTVDSSFITLDLEP